MAASIYHSAGIARLTGIAGDTEPAYSSKEFVDLIEDETRNEAEQEETGFHPLHGLSLAVAAARPRLRAARSGRHT